MYVRMYLPNKKKALLGKGGKVLSSDGLPDTSGASTSEPSFSGLEPATFFGMPREHYAEMVHCLEHGHHHHHRRD